jgi:GNAT superfamily N-acetyltransferase
LNIITVLPSEQGKGIGRALFEEVTKKADAEGIRCYLESSRDEPNTKIYEAMGFHFVREMDCDDDGIVCKLYCMVREPKVNA